MSYVTHLEAAIDGTILPARTLQTVHAGRPLWVRYDLDAIARSIDRDALVHREPTLWRYRELLPVDDDDCIVSLGEGMSPLLRCERLGTAIGLENLFIKDESQLPTGSFKARGLCMAVSMAKQLGATRTAIPTAGNAGGALAAYAARASMECFVFMPAFTPEVNKYEAAVYGARVFLVDGLIHDCGAIVNQGTEKLGWYDMSTLKEPYRIEGKKTMGLELAEQMQWSLPDVVFYPTGGGTGLIGMWKAFAELEQIGWIEKNRRPRMFACQSTGCAPLAEAFERGERFVGSLDNPFTKAAGLLVPKALGDFMILDAVRESGGRAVAADEQRLVAWMEMATRLEGIALCPEAAACLGALERSLQEGWISKNETVVVYNTGAVQKYVEVIKRHFPRVERGKIDWEALVSPPSRHGTA
ncbi:MAG: threonine synthase [Acidobacteriota bacterium]|nr:MAG: threonine synthase [Acidobacteriota bacterium]